MKASDFDIASCAKFDRFFKTTQFTGCLSGPAKLRVAVYGWFMRSNFGDDLFHLMLHTQWKADQNIIAFEFVNPDTNPAFLEKTMREADLIIWGPGDVINEYFLSKLPRNKPIHIFCAGVPYGDVLSKLKDYDIRTIRMRDADSHLITFNSGYFKNAYFEQVYDLVLSLPHWDKPFLTLAQQAPDLLYREANKKRAVICLPHEISAKFNISRSDNAYFEYFKWELAESLDYLSEWYQLLFLCLDPKDSSAGFDLQRRMRYGSKLATVQRAGMREIIGAIANADLVISGKLHGLVVSSIARNPMTPFINIGLTKKCDQFASLFCDEDDTGANIRPYSFTKTKLLEQVKKCENPRLTQPHDLAKRTYSIYADLHRGQSCAPEGLSGDGA